jgi:cardiolipin synthase
VDSVTTLLIRNIGRMLRFRLVQAVLIDGMPSFQASEAGAGVVASGEEIPTLKRPMTRKVAFVVDQITGTVFAKRDVKTDNARGIAFIREKGADIRDVQVTGASVKTSARENVARFQKVLYDDETLLHFDGDTLIERPDEFMLTVVDGKDIRGLPPNAPSPLVEQILNVARSKETVRPIRVPSLLTEEDEGPLPTGVSINFDHSDLIVGGADHFSALTDVFQQARRRILIHSTFVRQTAFPKLIGLFRSAVRRGARIDIFWGAGTANEPGERTAVDAAAISREIGADELLRDRVQVHLRSTGSHSKLLLADDGGGGYVAIVGSCNWLYTNFGRLDVSARLRDPRAVALVADKFCSLVAKAGFRPEVGTELHFLALNLAGRHSEAGFHRVRLIIGQAHEAILREASGTPSQRFIVASDRLGNSAFSNAIVPAEVFAAAAHTTPIVVFGDEAGLVTGKTASNMAQEARERGVRLLWISGGFHAKFLIWGDDDIVVTSLNWGSWTTSPDFPESEIGVHIHRTGIARDLNERLKLIWPQL